MSKKTDIVLDIAGVIATNFSPIFWEDLSSKFEVSYDSLLSLERKSVKNYGQEKLKMENFGLS
ncbi:hypothetical protein [Bacillus sp. J37]|uniref:hypothetical protein n=1 Tax=Bacillus sp. J37 TaxID=935837 RepID=UPI00047E0427|nr:hypothetical protein [Bacillus sp. J37]